MLDLLLATAPVEPQCMTPNVIAEHAMAEGVLSLPMLNREHGERFLRLFNAEPPASDFTSQGGILFTPMPGHPAVAMWLFDGDGCMSRMVPIRVEMFAKIMKLLNDPGI